MHHIFASVVLVGMVSSAFGVLPSRKDCDPRLGAEASRRFAYKLYSKASAEADSEENVFLAPTTVASVLAMILAGARGTTKEQIWKGLMFDSTSKNVTDDDLPCLLRMYSDALVKASIQQKAKDNEIVAFENPLVLRTASRLFGDQSYDFADSFLKTSERYGAKMEELDFRQAPGDARRYINDWTERETENKIKDLFGEDDIDSDTVLAFVSAIYFNGLWKTPFDERGTYSDDFAINSNKVVKANFMTETSDFKTLYSRQLDAELLELPYKEDAFGRYNVSMIIVLPLSRWSSIESLEQKLTEENLGPAISDLFQTFPSETGVYLPKFKITAEYKLKPLLQSMGMINMFTPGVADFSPMRDNTSPDKRPLYVSSAVHKTFIEVDEKGTEAAGATGMGMMALSLPPSFVCDRPFVTIIYEKNSDSILFIGKISDPTAE